MSNILIRGCPGTGKTYMSRAIAYYMCKENLSIDDSFNQNVSKDLPEIQKFFSSNEYCEYIQVHSSMDFNDIVYGLEIKANGGINMSYTAKRVMNLCQRAIGKSDKYCVIFDDINRANVSALLGSLLYAMEYKNQSINLVSDVQIVIPDNVIFIFTENTLNSDFNLNLAIRRRMTYVRELKSNKEIITNYYSGFISKSALRLITDIYDRIASFITSYISEEIKGSSENYIPGHGFFIVEKVGNTHFILDNFRQKIIYQICPYLLDIFSMGIIKADPTKFIQQIISNLNIGIQGICPISAIKKKMIKSGKKISSFSLEDSREYYKNVIVPKKCVDFRGMMECIIDALITNKIFPYDVLMSSLLQNTNIAYIESLRAPLDRAAYLVEKHKAPRFIYETVRGDRVSGTHAYYTLDSAITGRWAAEDDTEEYVVSYNDGRKDEEFIPLSGFRNHGFNPDVPELGVQHNTVNIMSAIHILLNKYYDDYESNISLISGDDPEYQNLLKYISLERLYLEAIKQTLKGRSSSAPKGDDNRLAFYGRKIQNLRLIWYGVGEIIEVDSELFSRLTTEKNAFSMDDFESMLFVPSSSKTLIEIKGVVKMVNFNDYQKIMENIGIRQLIFQGPPGTSKTFESKRFVLKQLNPSAPSLSKPGATQEDISKDLEAFKLTDVDYTSPKKSSKLQTGGWDLVQFHPSYGYEDFIRGIEVKIPEGATSPSYESVNRILGKIAEISKYSEAIDNGKNPPKFYLIVDEINRANLATVFGELIYGLEYRNSRVSTPYEVKEKTTGIVTKDITLSKNLFIIGTMNTADKSIDAIDYAIRRRFIFIDSPARRDVVISCYQNYSGKMDENSIELFLYDAVQSLFDNNRFFNNEYQKNDVRIGHTYFLRDRKKNYSDAIIEHFVFQVIPILREYIKDGIFDVTEDLVPIEHTPAEIYGASSGDERITMLSENIMLYVKDFGGLNKSNVQINNEYIGTFIEELRKTFGF